MIFNLRIKTTVINEILKIIISVKICFLYLLSTYYLLKDD